MDAIIGMFLLPKDIQLQKYEIISTMVVTFDPPPFPPPMPAHRISAGAASTLEELKTQTRAGLEFAIEKRKVRV